MINTQINQEYYTVYQPYMLLDYENSYKHDIPKDDLSVTIMEVLRRINLNDFIDFQNYDARSYDPVMMLAIILLAFSEEGSFFYCSNFCFDIFILCS